MTQWTLIELVEDVAEVAFELVATEGEESLGVVVCEGGAVVNGDVVVAHLELLVRPLEAGVEELLVVVVVVASVVGVAEPHLPLLVAVVVVGPRSCYCNYISLSTWK